MKRSELKKLIKPIVEECVKDALLTSGLLTSVISEVVAGVQKGIITEAKTETPVLQKQETENKQASLEARREKILEKKKKLLDAIGSDAYNGIDLFEGTEPLKKGGSSAKPTGGYSPFEGVDPSDPGVDISALTQGSKKIWERLKEK